MNRSILALSALSLATLSTPAAAAWGDHLTVAAQWTHDLSAANNKYGSPSEVWYVGSDLHVNAECGGFVSELMKASYPLLDDDVMSALMDDDTSDTNPWSSPDSAHWYDAITDQVSVTVGGQSIGLSRLTDIDDVETGDILASVYTSAGASGHTMVIRRMPTTYTLVTTTIPGYSGVQVERYAIQVLDSTQSVHLNQTGSTDSRYMHDVDSLGHTVNDTGMGTGDLLLYADHSSGAIIGWTWNTIQSTAYQGTDAGASNYRPIVAGRFVGTGI